MKINKMRALVFGMAVVAVAGCSTLVQGRSHEVAVDSPGAAGARCVLSGGDGVNASVISPGTVKVAKSKRNIKVTCTAPNGQVACRVFASSYSNYPYL